MKIQNKLFIFLFSFSLMLVTVLVLLIQWSIDKGMVEYVISKEVEILQPVLTQITDEYKVENNWQSLAGKHRRFHHLITQQLANSDFDVEKNPPTIQDVTDKKRHNKPRFEADSTKNRPPPRHNNFADFPPRPSKSEAHYALLDADESVIVGNYLSTLDYKKIAIEVDSRVVGYFAVSKRNQLTQGYEVEFIEQQQEYLWLIALLVMCLVTLVTFPLARHIVEPIKLITRGMHKLTQGDYQQSIQLNRKDELSELSRDYNELALTLVKNESTRKRWLANISHELRTPVAILRGELEAMLDSVRPLTHANIASANDEVKHLQCLIDDLNQLNSTDIGGMGYRKQPEELVQLMQSEAGKYRSYLSDAGINLMLELSDNEVYIYADKTRLYQLFENILNNCIKYSSASKLKVSLIFNKFEESLAVQSLAANNKGNVTIKFEDDGIGVDEEHLTHLFEYLYRVEDSRNRETGGFGLGLSICQNIVIAHQGEISAEKSSLGGLTITITLPLA